MFVRFHVLNHVVGAMVMSACSGRGLPCRRRDCLRRRHVLGERNATEAAANALTRERSALPSPPFFPISRQSSACSSTDEENALRRPPFFPVSRQSLATS